MSGRDSVGFLFHPQVDRGRPEVRAARDLVRERGLESWEVARDGLDAQLRRSAGRTRLLVTLGGDGTLLHGGRAAAARGIPLLGVNLGRLGFLTEVEAAELPSGIARFLDGEARAEERTLLAVTLERAGRRTSKGLALNEVVVNRGQDPGLIRTRLAIDGQELGVIDADGVLVSTATGSTAYALAAGGPILEPDLEDLVVVPMSPFALTVRPVVCTPTRAITIVLERGSAALTIDGGGSGRLRPGDVVSVAAHPRRLSLVRFSAPDRFYEVLRRKLGWGLPLVPSPEEQ